MTAAIVVPLSVLGAAVVILAIARLAPSAIELLDLDPRVRARDRLVAEQEDLEQLLELTNRERRSAGLSELTEQDLRGACGR